ncbi:MAG: hypothetical protein ACKOJF_08955 [Planctomycetaceae bacterium]
MRCANRNHNSADIENDNLSFRLVRAHDRVWIDLPEQIDFLSGANVTLAKTQRPPACW